MTIHIWNIWFFIVRDEWARDKRRCGYAWNAWALIIPCHAAVAGWLTYQRPHGHIGYIPVFQRCPRFWCIAHCGSAHRTQNNRIQARNSSISFLEELGTSRLMEPRWAVEGERDRHIRVRLEACDKETCPRGSEFIVPWGLCSLVKEGRNNPQILRPARFRYSAIFLNARVRARARATALGIRRNQTSPFRAASLFSPRRMKQPWKAGDIVPSRARSVVSGRVFVPPLYNVCTAYNQRSLFTAHSSRSVSVRCKEASAFASVYKRLLNWTVVLFLLPAYINRLIA